MFTIASCHIEDINDQMQSTEEFRFIAERFDNDNDNDTKTIRQDDGSIIWDSSEEIKVFTSNGASGKFVSTNDTPVSKAEFIGSFDKKVTDDDISNGIMALYPYSDDATYSDNRITFSIPSVQTAKEGTFDTGLFPSVAYSTSTSLYFHNVCAGIRFTVSQDGIRSVTFKGNDSEALAGKVSVSVADGSVGESVIEAKTEVTVNAPEEGYFEPGKEYYIVLLAPEWPTFMFWEGFSITYHKDTVSDTYESHKALELHRSQFATINEKDKGLAFIDPAQPIEFADDIMKEMCIVAFDSDGDGELSYGEAKSVRDLSQMELTKKTFKSFDEFQYFTNVKTIPTYYFQDSHLASIKLPGNIKEINGYAFSGCVKLKTINLPDGINFIGSYAFEDCTGLTEAIVLPQSLTEINTNTFRNCINIEEIILPESITTINSSAFHGCSYLKTINLPESLMKIGSMAFFRCSSMKNIVIPENIMTIEYGTFESCESLETIELPSNLISIKSNAFQSCSSLKSITIPSEVCNIEDSAFYFCEQLEEIYLKPMVPPTIHNNSFKYNSDNRKFYVPTDVVEDYKNDDRWAEYADNIVGYDFSNE